ncbi:hypothetical protein LCGC14_3109090, partial [marine sediment metagenome]
DLPEHIQREYIDRVTVEPLIGDKSADILV